MITFLITWYLIVYKIEAVEDLALLLTVVGALELIIETGLLISLT